LDANVEMIKSELFGITKIIDIRFANDVEVQRRGCDILRNQVKDPKNHAELIGFGGCYWNHCE
jgi:hypothetical protein